jgi:CubicO group peptidase (beta-lactamase class C family)
MRRFSILLLIIVTLSSCTVGRFIWYNFSDITDYKIFPSNQINKSSTPYTIPAKLTTFPVQLTIKGKTDPIEVLLKKSSTVGFMVIVNDTIRYQYFDNGYTDSSIVTSFSVSKSLVSMLVGCAIADGYIKSIEEPITDYIPELRSEMKAVKIKHLLQMTSGIKYSESYYSPFSDAAVQYYGTNLLKSVKKLRLKTTPGTRFEYISGNSQLLGMVVARAIKTKTLSQYLDERIWQPLGMEFPATWSTDSKKIKQEKAFCCLNARATDFAKIGLLYMHKGNWQGKQIVPAAWVNAAEGIDTTEGAKWWYQYNWWKVGKEGAYAADGHLGQYIYVDPKHKIVMVRFGKKSGGVDWRTLFHAFSVTTEVTSKKQ